MTAFRTEDRRGQKDNNFSKSKIMVFLLYSKKVAVSPRHFSIQKNIGYLLCCCDKGRSECDRTHQNLSCSAVYIDKTFSTGSRADE